MAPRLNSQQEHSRLASIFVSSPITPTVFPRSLSTSDTSRECTQCEENTESLSADGDSDIGGEIYIPPALSLRLSLLSSMFTLLHRLVLAAPYSSVKYVSDNSQKESFDVRDSGKVSSTSGDQYCSRRSTTE